MKWEYEVQSTRSYLVMHSYKAWHWMVNESFTPMPGLLNTIVFNKENARRVTIDGVTYTMPAFSILLLVSHQEFHLENSAESITIWQFNQEFYCMENRHAEINYVEFFYGTHHHPSFITLGKCAIDDMQWMENAFIEEWGLQNHFQGRMLHLLLERLLIKTARLANTQYETCCDSSTKKAAIISNFSLLLEKHFRTHHDVQFYALVLKKSPKTLANTFHLLQQPSPSRLIQQRLLMEAKRLLCYTNKSAKEIGYSLGFKSPENFSRFFKLNTHITISQFRNTQSLMPGQTVRHADE